MHKTPLAFVTLFTAALGTGIVGGIFFAFSSFVMAALARIPAAQGIAAMNSINAVVLNPIFMTPFPWHRHSVPGRDRAFVVSVEPARGQVCIGREHRLSLGLCCCHDAFQRTPERSARIGSRGARNRRVLARLCLGLEYL